MMSVTFHVHSEDKFEVKAYANESTWANYVVVNISARENAINTQNDIGLFLYDVNHIERLQKELAKAKKELLKLEEEKQNGTNEDNLQLAGAESENI